MEIKNNPKVQINDEVILLEDILDNGNNVLIYAGSVGSVIEIRDDFFFGPDEKVIQVEWSDKRKLNIFSNSDRYLKLTETLNEQAILNMDDDMDNFLQDLENVRAMLGFFDTNLIYQFYDHLRASGIINMHQAARYIYRGEKKIKQQIDYEYDGTAPFEEEGEMLLSMADEVKQSVIASTLDYMNELDIDEDNIDRVIGKCADMLFRMWINQL